MASEFFLVAEAVLEKIGRPLRVQEIVQLGIQDKLFSDNVAGKTPHQTMKSKLSVDIMRKGTESRFVRTAPGLFFLRRLLPESHPEYRAPRFEKRTSHEPVLVFPAAQLNRWKRFQGISVKFERMAAHLLTPKLCHYMDRAQAEEDSRFKQVLTYVMLTRRGRVLCYKRGSYSLVAEFLRGAHCIGFGGHVTHADRLPLFPQEDMGVQECVLRELSEELQLPKKDVERLRQGIGLHCVGALNDDSSDVGQRHFAFVFRYEVSRDPYWNNPERGEKSVTQLRWIGSGNTARIWDFEYWSQLCLQQFFPDLVDTSSDFRLVRKSAFANARLLCVLGEVGSGKTELTKILTRDYGYREINSGRIIAELMNIPPVPTTPRQDFQKLAWSFISTAEGPVKLAQAIHAKAREVPSSFILVDGIRQKSTLDALRQLAQPFSVPSIYVHTLPHIAYSFYNSRLGYQVPINEFLSVRSAEVEGEVAAMITVSDAVLYNWTGKQRFNATIRRMMAEIRT